LYLYKLDSINNNLEAIAKQLYDYWFVQFDFPNSEGKPYKSSGGKMIWNEKLKSEIPVGWSSGSLLDIAIYTNGLACQQYRPETEDKLPVIRIKVTISLQMCHPYHPQMCWKNNFTAL